LTAGGAFSEMGAAGATGFGAGGETTAVFSAGGGGATGALGATTVGFSCTRGGATAGFTGAFGATAGGAAAIGGRGGATGRCNCSSRSLSWRATSPGLWTLEKSILGLTSGGAGRSRMLAELDLAVKCLLTASASWSSIEDEWVFLSVMPSSGKTSKIAFALTSSSLASSLILIRSAFPLRVIR